MKGQNFGARFSLVSRAQSGEAGHGLGEFSSTKPNVPSSWSWLFAAPVMDSEEAVVGVALAGIPLWRLAQRLSRQLRVEQVGEGSSWVYLYKGDRLFHWDTPPEVDAAVPSAAARSVELAKSPDGYVGSARIAGGAQYAFGAFPLAIADDVGMVIFRTTE